MLIESDEMEPKGSWFERWIPGVCLHLDVRCVHGDEIIKRKFRRRVCRTCGRSVKGTLPPMCYYTNKPHNYGEDK